MIDAKTMLWRPPMIYLTQIANPQHDDGQPTRLCVDPVEIIMICRTLGGFDKRNPDGTYEKCREPKSCTAVGVRNAGTVLCEESVEQVAILRERALGNPTAVAAP